MNILAHRGCWRDKAEQNTLPALQQALIRGMGIETDLRDRNGDIAVSHDMSGPQAPSLRTLVTGIAQAGGNGMLAWNVKADGLAVTCRDLIGPDLMSRSFFFDMSVPDMRAYLALDLPVFTRHSDVEPAPAYYDRAAGVWLDELDGEWLTEETIGLHLDAGKKVAVVSGELHRRPHARNWALCRAFNGNDRIMLCTDLVDEALEYFA